MSDEVMIRMNYGTAVMVGGVDLYVVRWPDGEVYAIVCGGYPTTPWAWAGLSGLLPHRRRGRTRPVAHPVG